MGRERSPARDKAYEIYKQHNGNIELVKIADELGLSPSTIRAWKNKDGWEELLNGDIPKKYINKIKKIDERSDNTERSNENTERSEKIRNAPKNVEYEAHEITPSEIQEVVKNKELTEKQKLFCVYYIKYFNATKAYKKAYNCNYATANANGYRQLSNVVIREEIEKIKRKQFNKAMLSTEVIFQKYIDIAFSDITDYLTFGRKEIDINTENGTDSIEVNYVDFNDSYDIDGSLISEISQGKDGVKIKLQDKMKALQWLSDRMDLLPIATKEKLKLENKKVEHLLKDDNKVKEPIEIVIKRKEALNAN